FPSQYSGTPGTTITLSGSGFTSTDNTIYFGDKYAVVKATSQNSQNITIKVPSIPKGIYPLLVKNARGVSDRGPWFVVTDGITPTPKIDSVTPKRATRGNTITIKGSGFTPAGNVIQYGGGVIMNISSSDGGSLSFSLPAELFMSATSSFAKKVSLLLWITVINENGVSNQKSYTLEI
ncbi:MAG: IPT/TIG domain-containing protein, partial [Patescibacteria group bacterium]